MCESHEQARDDSEITFSGHMQSAAPGALAQADLTVVGPTENGSIGLMYDEQAGWIWLQRFVVEDVIRELQRRLALRA